MMAATALFGGCVGTATAKAQQQPAKAQQDPSVFRQLFPEPTGQNGYEELVQAGDLVRNNEAGQAATATGATLDAKRRALADPDVKRALALVRRGLNKPIRSPRTEFTAGTLLPDFAPLRHLARLLAVEQYVALADGRTGDAISALRDGLRIAHAPKGDLIIGGLVGAVMDAIVLNRLARHLDQMSARDCDRLVALAREYLRTPDPTFVTLDNERRMALATLDLLRRFPDHFPTYAGVEDEDETTEPDPLARDIEALAADPAALEQVVSRAEAQVNAFYAAQAAAYRLPPHQRPDEVPLPQTPAPQSDPAQRLVAQLMDLLLPAVSGATTRFTQARIQVQLLGVHAAIRRFRWEHDRLPETLADLRLGNLGVDPYSGRPLVYERIGGNDTATTYTLASVGPTKRDDEDKPVPGQRVPILLPQPPRPPQPAP
jgi:hypothetical protein